MGLFGCCLALCLARSWAQPLFRVAGTSVAHIVQWYTSFHWSTRTSSIMCSGHQSCQCCGNRFLLLLSASYWLHIMVCSRASLSFQRSQCSYCYLCYRGIPDKRAAAYQFGSRTLRPRYLVSFTWATFLHSGFASGPYTSLFLAHQPR